MISYYRRFIQGYACLAHLLHALTRKDAKFDWNDDCLVTFDALKERLCSAPILAYPSFTFPYILETDARGRGLGAVLSQQHDNGHVHQIAFASRSLNKAEQITVYQSLKLWLLCGRFLISKLICMDRV